MRDISLSLISAVNAGDRTILVPSHLRSHLLSKANKVQGERRAKLARAMLSRSLYSQCISKCIAKIQHFSDAMVPYGYVMWTYGVLKGELSVLMWN